MWNMVKPKLKYIIYKPEERNPESIRGVCVEGKSKIKRGKPGYEIDRIACIYNTKDKYRMKYKYPTKANPERLETVTGFVVSDITEKIDRVDKSEHPIAAEMFFEIIRSGELKD